MHGREIHATESARRFRGLAWPVLGFELSVFVQVAQDHQSVAAVVVCREVTATRAGRLGRRRGRPLPPALAGLHGREASPPPAAAGSTKIQNGADSVAARVADA